MIRLVKSIFIHLHFRFYGMLCDKNFLLINFFFIHRIETDATDAKTTWTKKMKNESSSLKNHSMNAQQIKVANFHECDDHF